jgi:hypothetical protein
VRGPKKQNSVKARKRLFENLQATIQLRNCESEALIRQTNNYPRHNSVKQSSY